MVETVDEGLEFGIRALGGVSATEHRGHRPVVTDGVGAAGIEDSSGLQISVAAFNTDRMNGLEPKHVHAKGGVVVFIESVGASLEAAGFSLDRRIVDEVEEGAAAAKGGVFGLDDEGIDLIHVHLKGLLGRNDDGAIAALGVVGVVDEVVGVDSIDLVADLQAVGAAEVHGQGDGVVTIGIRTGHGIGAEVGV